MRAELFLSQTTFSYRAVCRNILEEAQSPLHASNTWANRRSAVAPPAGGGCARTGAELEGLLAAGPGSPRPLLPGLQALAGRSVTLQTPENMFFSPALSTLSWCLPPPLSHPPQRFKERWKKQAEVPAFATFASDARRDLGILPAAYLENPKAHQEQNKRDGKNTLGLSTQSGSTSSRAGAKAARVIPANLPGKEPRPALRKGPG